MFIIPTAAKVTSKTHSKGCGAALRSGPSPGSQQLAPLLPYRARVQKTI